MLQAVVIDEQSAASKNVKSATEKTEILQELYVLRKRFRGLKTELKQWLQPHIPIAEADAASVVSASTVHDSNVEIITVAPEVAGDLAHLMRGDQVRVAV